MGIPQKTVIFLTVLLLMTACLSTRVGLSKSNQSKENEIETNIRVPVVIKNIPSKKHLLKERMKHFETPGMSVAVIEHGNIAWAKGYGVRESGKEEKVDTKTVFQAASMSKPFTALGILSLVKDGRIKLDADVVVVGTKPGSFFQYSGGGYEILQLLIEDITGQPFEKFMKETILAPLGMTHSTFEYPLPKNISSEAASAHNRNEVVKGRWHIYPEKAAAALWTTPTDMAKMIISIHRCAKGIAEQNGLSKILGQKLCQEMLTMHEWPLQNGRTKKMGLGFMVVESMGLVTVY